MHDNAVSPEDKKRVRIWVLGMIFVCLLLAAPFLPSLPAEWFERFNSQATHLRQIEAHIEAIQPQWKAFCEQHPEMAKVELFAFTGGAGLFGAAGEIPSEA